MSDPNAFPTDPAQEPVAPAAADVDPSLNPFAGNQPVEQQQSKLGLGGNILGRTGVLIPPAQEAPTSDGEILKDADLAARKACGLIAEMFMQETDPDSIVFPKCDDMNVVNLALQQLGNTPLGLGFGRFPDSVPKAWARFLNETAANYRQSHGLGLAHLVPVEIQMPDWLAQNPRFDILEGCEVMDISIGNPVRSVIASDVKYCRVHFRGAVLNTASIGIGANRSTFIFDDVLLSDCSFNNASNVSIEIKGKQRGSIGPVSASVASCAGNFGGLYVIKDGTGCKIGEGIHPSNNVKMV